MKVRPDPNWENFFSGVGLDVHVSMGCPRVTGASSPTPEKNPQNSSVWNFHSFTFKIYFHKYNFIVIITEPAKSATATGSSFQRERRYATAPRTATRYINDDDGFSLERDVKQITFTFTFGTCAFIHDNAFLKLVNIIQIMARLADKSCVGVHAVAAFARTQHAPSTCSARRE